MEPETIRSRDQPPLLWTGPFIDREHVYTMNKVTHGSDPVPEDRAAVSPNMQQ